MVTEHEAQPGKISDDLRPDLVHRFLFFVASTADRKNQT